METIGWPPVDPDRVQLYDANGPLRMPISSHTLGSPALIGKVESGSVQEGDSLLIMPNKVQVKVVAVLNDDGEEVGMSITGDISQVRVSGIPEEDIVLPGSVLCSLEKPISVVHTFTAKLFIVADKIIIVSGYMAVLEIHSAVEECEILELMHLIDRNSGKPAKKKAFFAKKGNVCLCHIQVPNMVCVEKYCQSQQLGRFTLRSLEGRTVALGKVTQLA